MLRTGRLGPRSWTSVPPPPTPTPSSPKISTSPHQRSSTPIFVTVIIIIGAPFITYDCVGHNILLCFAFPEGYGI
uniref:Uncharacterized protein n=1 Tax=Rhizophora mucronata TaxID=61149 RepID=A0A2P2N182_RHIMU